MKDLIKKVLLEYTKEKKVIKEMARQVWCSEFRTYTPEYHFCNSAENYIKNELEDVPSVKGKKRSKKVFMDFEKAIQKFFEKVGDDPELTKKMIRIDNSSQIYKDGKAEMDLAVKLLKNNCSKIEEIKNKKLKMFEDKVVVYFLENEAYSLDNRLPTNYSALAVLFTKFLLNKGAFDGVINKGHDWDYIAKNWITHIFHPSHDFEDIRPEDEQKNKLTSLTFDELSRIYFTNDRVYNSEDIRKSVKRVLEGVRGKGFESEDGFEKEKLAGKREYVRFAKDYGFVDMYLGIDFIYKGNSGMFIPVQVKTTATEPTYLISTLGCKAYIIAEKKGKKFAVDPYPKQENLPD